MLNFFNLEFERVIAHRILAARDENEPASAIYSQTLLNLNDDVIYQLQEKLNDAQLKLGKCFDMFIHDTLETSFFGMASNLDSFNDVLFISASQKLAERLATAQSFRSLAGGYLFIIQAKFPDSDNYALIAIKAETIQALKFEQNAITIFDDLLFGPQSKFFKFGVIYKREPWELEVSGEYPQPNNEWGAILFDEAFRPDSKLARYFYDEFLGFSADSNPKLLSKRFYEQTEKYLTYNVEDYNRKKELLGALDFEFTQNQEASVSPSDFADTYFANEPMYEGFINEVAEQLPEQFEKNPQLIKTKLNNKKILFPGGIKVSGPAESLQSNFEIIDSDEKIRELTTRQETYTIIKLRGKPFGK